MIETNNFNKRKQLNDVISIANIELKEMLKNGRCKKDFKKVKKQLLLWELELAKLNLAEFRNEKGD